MDSELQDAFDWVDSDPTVIGLGFPVERRHITALAEAARKYATPDYEAATVYAVKLFMGERAARGSIPPHIRTGSERIVRIALDVTEDE